VDLLAEQAAGHGQARRVEDVGVGHGLLLQAALQGAQAQAQALGHALLRGATTRQQLDEQTQHAVLQVVLLYLGEHLHQDGVVVAREVRVAVAQGGVEFTQREAQLVAVAAVCDRAAKGLLESRGV